MSHLILVAAGEVPTTEPTPGMEPRILSSERWRARQIGLRISNLAVQLVYISGEAGIDQFADIILLAQENRTRIKIESKDGLRAPESAEPPNMTTLRQQVANHHAESALFLLRGYAQDPQANLLTIASAQVIEAYDLELSTVPYETNADESALSKEIRVYGFSDSGQVVSRDIYLLGHGAPS